MTQDIEQIPRYDQTEIYQPHREKVFTPRTVSEKALFETEREVIEAAESGVSMENIRVMIAKMMHETKRFLR